jgi:hypothetical protein
MYKYYAKQNITVNGRSYNEGEIIISSDKIDGLTELRRTVLDNNDIKKIQQDIKEKKELIKEQKPKYNPEEMNEKIADIIIPHHNRHDLLKNTLDKLPNNIFNIIIVSGGTFAENCNKGAKLAKTDNLIFMNDDIEPNVDHLIDSCKMKEDIVGFSEILPNDNNVIVYGIGWEMANNGLIRSDLKRDPRDVHIPSGFLFRIKKDAWRKLGGFDERFKNGCEDVDLGLRAKEKKMTMGFINKNPITHYHQQSEGRLRYNTENKKKLKEIWTDEKIKKTLNLKKNKKTALVTNHFMRTFSGIENNKN